MKYDIHVRQLLELRFQFRSVDSRIEPPSELTPLPWTSRQMYDE